MPEVAELHEVASKALFDKEVKGLIPELLSARSWLVHNCEYPIIDIEFCSDTLIGPLRLICDFSQWSTLPPSVTLCESGGNPLKKLQVTGTDIFHVGPHENTGLPFVCMAGTLEYHTHPSHISDHWENYKNRTAYSIGGIITQIWNGWRKCTEWKPN